MADFDFKLIVLDTEENRKKIEKRGITQFYTTRCFDIEFYPSEQDYYEDWNEFCEPIPDNEVCKECEAHDYLLENADLCPRFRKIIYQVSFTYRTLKTLVYEIIGSNIIVIYGCKKDAFDKTRELFGERDFYNAYNKMKDWATKTFDKWLSLGNDDLNGWEVEGWKIKTREEYNKIIEAIAWIRKIYWEGSGCISFDEKTEKHIDQKIKELEPT